MVSLPSPSRRVTAQTSKILGKGHTIRRKELYIIQKVASRKILGPGRHWSCDHGASSEPAASSVPYELHAVTPTKSTV